MACEICPALTKSGNDAIDHSFDNFHRYYLRYFCHGETQSPKRNYQYKALQNGDHTRLLELLPGNRHDDICCLLSEITIDNPPRYAALSYTWGTTERRKTVLIDNQSFLVTDNLWAALWHLRHTDRSRIIWVDAICVNQDNTEERNQVVLRMKNIYEHAEEVLAWLGPEGNNGLLALTCIKLVFHQYCMHVDRLGSPDAAFRYMLNNRDWTALSGAAWEALNTMLQGRTWFRRVWIVQEGTVPVRTTFYLCHSTLQAKALYTVFRLLKSLPATTFPNNIIKPDLAPHISALAEFSQRRLYEFKGSPFIDMLGMLRDHLASDDHDKVYAGLGFTIGTNLSIPVDYNKPLSEVLRDAAVSCLRQPPHSLRFLGHAGLIGTAHMPATWMPDWFFPNILTPFPKVPTSPRSNDTNILFNACDIHHQIWTQAGYSELEPFTDGHTLTVHGVLVDYVRTGSVTGGFPNTISSIEDAWHLPNMHKTYSPTGETREQAYLRTLVADLKMVEGEVVGRGGSMYWRNRSKSPPTPGQVDTECLLAQVCIGRRLITTMNHHYIGIAPLHTQPGDAIFMVKYGEVLYIARPTLDGTYHFVGEAYIHGVMDGLVTEQLFNGQGEMQTIEFVPVLGDVANSNESPSTLPGNPVSFKSRDIGHGLLRHEYSNRHENMDFKVHDNLGRQMQDEIKDAIDETMESLTDSTTVEEATRKICVECVWALDLKRKLLYSEDEKIEPKSGVCLYGRKFARRSYILAAIDLEIERTRVAILGEFGNLAPYKAGLHVLDVETIENEKQEDAWLKEDEALARELQAQEFISAGLLEHPRNGGTGPILPPQTRQPARLPLLQRRTGPPARLMMAESRNPYTFAYQFRSKEDHALFLQDLQQWTPPRSGLLQRPILVGCWATDPLRRPRVIVQTSGPPPDIWWEDEDGNVVDGPNVGVEGGRLEISDRHDKRGEIDVSHDDWEDEGEAELPSEFEYVE